MSARETEAPLVMFAPLNPFRNSIVDDAWGKSAEGADVGRIHRDVYETCLQAVEYVRRGASSAGVMMYGEAGSGKTHLIRRLRRTLTDVTITPSTERLSQAFAYVRLNANPAMLFRHVRQRIVDDLLKRTGPGLSQLERMILARLMDANQGEGDICGWWDYVVEERRDELPAMVEEFGEQEDLSNDFVQVLKHLVLRQHRGDVRAWLKGDALREEASERLQVAPSLETDSEGTSRGVLVDLARLAGSQVPLVICFDQVEALQSRPDDSDAFFQYGQLITELHAADTNLVLISCVQSSLLDRFSAAIPGYAMARLKSFAARPLQPLGFDLARELLLHRIGSVMPGSESGTTASLDPLTDDDVRELVGPTGCTPRVLLDRATVRWDALHSPLGDALPKEEPAPLDERLNDEFFARLEQIRSRNRPEETEVILTDGIRRLVPVVDESFQVSDGQSLGLDYVLAAPRGEARVGVKVLESDGNRLASQLRTLTQVHPGKANLHKLVLLRDERRPISKTAAKSHEYLTTLQKNDALFAPVGPEAIAALDAIRQLLADAAAGDLDLSGEQVGPVTVIEWLRRNLPMPLKELADLLVTQAPENGPSLTCERLQEHLAACCVSSVDEAARAVGVPGETVRGVVAERPDLFGAIGGEPAVVFSVRRGSRCLSSAVE